MKNQMTAVQSVVTTADSRVAQHRAPNGPIGVICDMTGPGIVRVLAIEALRLRAHVLKALFGKETPDNSLPAGWDSRMFEAQVTGALELMARRKVKVKDMDTLLVTVSKAISVTTGKHEGDVLDLLFKRVRLASRPARARIVMQATDPIAALGEERRKEQHLVDAAMALAESRNNDFDQGRRAYVHGGRILASA